MTTTHLRKLCLSNLLAIVTFCPSLMAQVKIGGSPGSPASSAVLELDGGAAKGFLLPRMTKDEMMAIAAPAQGLLVYTSDEQTLYLRKNGVWTKLNAPSDPFFLPYSGTFNSADPILWLRNTASFGGAARFESLNTSATSNALEVISKSTGTNSSGEGGAYFKIDNTNSQAAAIFAEIASNNLGNYYQTAAVFGISKGIRGNGGVFEIANENSNSHALVVINNGNGRSIQASSSGSGTTLTASKLASATGSVVSFTNDNAANTSPLLLLTNSATGEMMRINGNNPNIILQHTGTSKGFLQISNTDDLRTGTVAGNSTGKFIIRNNGTDRVAVDQIGRVGIGTISPATHLHIFGDWASANSDQELVRVDGFNPIIQLQNISSDVGFIQAAGSDLRIGCNASNNVGDIIFRSNAVNRMYIKNNSNVVIGVSSGLEPAGNHKLAVKGGIVATAYDVLAIGSWPDYVFEKSYKLTSLQETEAYINKHKHLPGIPAASEVEKNGYELSDMQKRMMEKIEELTLHLIEANKEIQLLKTQMAEKK